MATLESLTPGATVQGLLPDRSVSVVQAEWHGAGALTLTYRDEAGRVGQELVYRDDEPRLAVIESGRAWSIDADGQLFRLVSEGKRISLAYLFDPFLAVQTSNLEPLPHQIDAVYNEDARRASRCASCSPTTPAPARRSWPGCSARS